MPPDYAREFYQTLGQGAASSADVLVPMVLEYLQPASVVDVGCGTAEWLAAFGRRGITDIVGVDGPWVDADLLQVPKDRFRVVDLTQPLRLDRTFDLVVSLEVAEHLPPSAAETFVESLTNLGPVLLFSAAIPFQGGTHHVNERWPSYWVSLFSKRGFRAVDCLRPRLWNNVSVDLCYAQNSFFVVAESALARWPTLTAAAQLLPDPPLDLVHPRLFLQSTAFAKGPKELMHGAVGAMRDRWLIRSRREAFEAQRRLAKWPSGR